MTGHEKKVKHLRKLAAERELTPLEFKFLERMIRMSRIRDLPGLLSNPEELEDHLKRVHGNGEQDELRVSILRKLNGVNKT